MKATYLEPLAIALDKEKWSLVQFLFSSSYTGYGISSLKEVTNSSYFSLRWHLGCKWVERKSKAGFIENLR
ncbi:putative fusarinine C esterase SidJ, alpha/Beta hydrolase [Helianthus anomalus]